MLSFILSASGTNWLRLPHLNSHGNNQVKDGERLKLAEMFRKTRFTTLDIIRARYAADFKICGYTNTESIISDILNEKRRLAESA